MLPRARLAVVALPIPSPEIPVPVALGPGAVVPALSSPLALPVSPAPDVMPVVVVPVPLRPYVAMARRGRFLVNDRRRRDVELHRETVCFRIRHSGVGAESHEHGRNPQSKYFSTGHEWLLSRSKKN